MSLRSLTRRRRPIALLAFATSMLAVAVPASESHAVAATRASSTSNSVSVTLTKHDPTASHRQRQTKSKVVKRFYINNGKKHTVSKNHVKVTVGTTRNLRSLQQIKVKWSGAHVTDGVSPDVNSDLAQNEEYSFDLFECRGVDSTKVPKKDQISPETCWTQFADERFQYGYDSWPAWRSDAYESAKDRKAKVGVPHKQPSECRDTLFGTATQRWVPFVGVADTYPGGPSGCAGEAPEASPANLSSLALPSNETFGVTDKDGRGSANFDVFTNEDHASLGCSSTVPCSLVAIPIEGISCDPAGFKLPKSDRRKNGALKAATKSCETNGNFTPGELLNNVEESGAQAVDGSLWWSESNWRNRISFPLTFAPADDVCNVVTKQKPLDIYGSELMTQATTQWAPHFCLNSKLFNLKHVQTPEPEARNLLSAGNIHAVLGSDPPTIPYSTPTVNAPVAVTGFGIAYDIDNNHQRPVTDLKLDPRLLAKLLTESYPAQNFVKSTYPKTKGVATLSKNPINIGQDPEFKALNPGIPAPEIDSAATLLTLNTQSDVMTALTSYINADPAARAWLNGKPDPWGMRVNPNYKGIKLPVNTWPTLDTYEPTDEYQIGKNDCLAIDPLPYLPLVAAPTAALFSIAQDMEFAISQSQTSCSLPSPIPGSTAGAKLVANGRQSPGHQFMLGVVSLGDASRYDLQLASLETHTKPGAATKFHGKKGRTFVPPNNHSMRRAVDLFKPDKKTGTWPINYKLLRHSKRAVRAYPGTMLVYASIPTQGLSKDTARAYADLLDFTAGEGQNPGLKLGDLAAGYLPLTAANGLAKLQLYTRRSAIAVSDQLGEKPSLTHYSKLGPPASTPPTSPPPTTTVTPPPTTTKTTSPPKPATSPTVAPTPAPTTSSTPVALTRTKAVGAGFGRELFPIIVLLFLLAGGTAVGLRIYSGRPSK